MILTNSRPSFHRDFKGFNIFLSNLLPQMGKAFFRNRERHMHRSKIISSDVTLSKTRTAVDCLEHFETPRGIYFLFFSQYILYIHLHHDLECGVVIAWISNCEPFIKPIQDCLPALKILINCGVARHGTGGLWKVYLVFFHHELGIRIVQQPLAQPQL
jgi:hypothetical protein